MSIFGANVGLDTIRHITTLWRGAKSNSLVEYTKPMRVEPNVFIDTDVQYSDGLHDTLQSLLRLFSGYYLMAATLGNTVGRIEVMRELEKLNPERSVSDAAAQTAGWVAGKEQFAYGLPTFGKSMPGLEAADPFFGTADYDSVEEANRAGLGVGRDAIKTITEASDLSVGKLLMVEMSDGVNRASFPVAVRLRSQYVPSNTLVHILGKDGKNSGYKERLFYWNAGLLSTWKDMVFCKDLVDQHYHKLIADKDGIMRGTISRKRKNMLAGLLSGNPSVATVSNMVIMSSETAMKFEAENNVSFKNFKSREGYFEDTTLMLLAVVDNRWNQVTIYTASIDTPVVVSFRDMKSANKGSGPDVVDILKAYSQGSAPSL